MKKLVISIAAWVLALLSLVFVCLYLESRRTSRLAAKNAKLEARVEALSKLVVVKDKDSVVDVMPTGILVSNRTTGNTEIRPGKVVVHGFGGSQVAIFGGAPGQEPYIEVISPGLPPRRFFAITEVLPVN